MVSGQEIAFHEKHRNLIVFHTGNIANWYMLPESPKRTRYHVLHEHTGAVGWSTDQDGAIAVCLRLLAPDGIILTTTPLDSVSARIRFSVINMRDHGWTNSHINYQLYAPVSPGVPEQIFETGNQRKIIPVR